MNRRGRIAPATSGAWCAATPSSTCDVAKTPNYNYEKRRKELERKAKKEAKQQRKRESATLESAEPVATDKTPDSPR